MGGAACHSAPMIKSTLFAVSTDEQTHNRLTTQAAIVAEINAAGGPRNVDAHIRLHKYDEFAANAWLRYVSDEKFSEAAINALAPDQQNERVVELWDAYGRFWQTLNICPYSFARFRRLCEKKWGYASYGGIGEGFKGKINTPYMNGNTAVLGEWRSLIHTITYTPQALGANPNEKGRWTPAWGGDRSEFWTGNNNPDFGPTDVIFGDPNSYAYENAGARPDEADSLPETAFAPTVEVHRIWMQRNGKLIGSYPNGLNAAYANSAWFYGSLNFSAAWRRYPIQDPRTYRAGQQWNDWNVGFTVADARQSPSTTRGMNRAQSTDVQWTVPPLKWYWELLRGSQTLTRGSRSAAEDEFTGNIIEYLSSRTTEEIIREVMLDVVKRNVAMVSETGKDTSDLGAGGELAELRRMQDNAERTAQINSFIAAGGAGLGGVLTVAMGPAGTAIAGTLTAAAKLLATVITQYEYIEARRTDIFGRLTPTLDTVSINDSNDAVRDLSAVAGLPPGVQRPVQRPLLKGAALNELLLNPLLTMDISSLVESGALIERQGGRLRIIGMPPAGRIEVGTTRRPATGGRWEPDGQTVYVVDLPLGGPLYVRITSPSGETRMAKTEAAPTQSVDLTWANMFGEHQIEVTAFPPGGRVFVDGVESMGTWKDASMTSWLVFMPQGNRDLRLVPPTGDTVVTSVAATGPTSVGSWIALSSVGIQQRQEAAAALAAEEARKKRTKQLMIAGGVGLAAIVVVGGIMLIRRKPQANPDRRRRRRR